MAQQLLENNTKLLDLRSIINSNFLEIANTFSVLTLNPSLTFETINNKDSLLTVRQKINYNFLTFYDNLTSVIFETPTPTPTLTPTPTPTLTPTPTT